MNPVLHAVSRLLDSEPGELGALPVEELAATLAEEPRLRMATRLALVGLAARCEQPDAVPPEQARACTLCAPLLARQLERLSTLNEDEALAGLVDLAPQLRELAAELRQGHDTLAILPQAILELLRNRLH
jgi:hypothetical protein